MIAIVYTRPLSVYVKSVPRYHILLPDCIDKANKANSPLKSMKFLDKLICRQLLKEE